MGYDISPTLPGLQLATCSVPNPPNFPQATVTANRQYLTYLLACLPAFLLSCLLACLLSIWSWVQIWTRCDDICSWAHPWHGSHIDMRLTLDMGGILDIGAHTRHWDSHSKLGHNSVDDIFMNNGHNACSGLLSAFRNHIRTIQYKVRKFENKNSKTSSPGRTPRMKIYLIIAIFRLNCDHWWSFLIIIWSSVGGIGSQDHHWVTISSSMIHWGPYSWSPHTNFVVTNPSIWTDTTPIVRRLCKRIFWRET